MSKIPTYDCKITGLDNTGLFAMSFVDFPANESNFVALRQNAPVKLVKDSHKQVLTGAVLIPNQIIYRNDENGEYNIRFTADEIEKITHKMMRMGLALQSTTHQHEKKLKGNYLVEVWIVTDPKRDKSVALGLGELRKGTLCASYKISDSTYWRTQVMTGKVRGFSIEGIFNFKTVNMKKPVITAQAAGKKLSPLGVFLQNVGIPVAMEDTAAAAGDLAKEAKKDETDSGEPLLVFDLEDGGEMHVDAEGFCTLDGAQMPPGEHLLADGNAVEVADDGTLVVTKPEPTAEEAEQAVAAAKAKAKEFLQARAELAKAKTDPRDAEIAALKAKVTELSKAPSADKAKPKQDGADAGTGNKFTDQIANVIQMRRASQAKKK